MPDHVMIPKELLERLAPPQPINQDEQGGCIWCGGSPVVRSRTGKIKTWAGGQPVREPYGYATEDPQDHEDDCPWVAARTLLKEV